jgi:hypothetical protein
MLSVGVGIVSESDESLLQLINNKAVRIVQIVLVMIFGFGLGFDQKYANWFNLKQRIFAIKYGFVNQGFSSQVVPSVNIT